MVLTFDQKKAVVEEIRQMAEAAVSVIVAEYRGLHVAEMMALRKECRTQSVTMKVVPNTLAKRALEDTSYACLEKELEGPVVLMFAFEHPGAGARIVRSFIKENEQLIPKAFAFEGVAYRGSELEFLANMPTQKEAMGLLVTVLEAPVSKFARTCAEIYTRVARVCQQVAEKKQVTV